MSSRVVVDVPCPIFATVSLFLLAKNLNGK
jgi:hypothetical protein